MFGQRATRNDVRSNFGGGSQTPRGSGVHQKLPPGCAPSKVHSTISQLAEARQVKANTRQGKARHTIAEQSKARQIKAYQSKANQNKAKAKQCKSKHIKANQSKARCTPLLVSLPRLKLYGCNRSRRKVRLDENHTLEQEN